MEVLACSCREQGFLYVYVDQRVFDVFVAEQLHNVDYVFGFMVFHSGFPVAESVEVYLHYSGVGEFSCYAPALFVEV